MHLFYILNYLKYYIFLIHFKQYLTMQLHRMLLSH